MKSTPEHFSHISSALQFSTEAQVNKCIPAQFQCLLHGFAVGVLLLVCVCVLKQSFLVYVSQTLKESKQPPNFDVHVSVFLFLQQIEITAKRYELSK